jgi:hypothetical protein
MWFISGYQAVLRAVEHFRFSALLSTFHCSTIAPRGFEPLNENQQAIDNKALTENQNPVLSTGLDKVLQKHPDLALVVERWPDLPDAIKTAIKALIQTHTATA